VLTNVLICSNIHNVVAKSSIGKRHRQKHRQKNLKKFKKGVDKEEKAMYNKQARLKKQGVWNLEN